MDSGADGWLHFAGGIRIRPERLVFTASRAGGPGGQHVNTTESRVTLHVRLADFQGGDPGFADRLRRIAGSRMSDDDTLVLHCQTDRSQQRNRELVGQRLRELVDRAARRPRQRRVTRPTRASIERRLNAKSRRGRTKSRRRPPDENA